jgi:hypothetical protein
MVGSPAQIGSVDTGCGVPHDFSARTADAPDRCGHHLNNDGLILGANVDRADGGAGNDIFRLKEGFVDFVNGGSGTDTATVDSFDSLTTVEIVK